MSEQKVAQRRLSLPEREALRMQMKELLADLDLAGQWLAAARISSAIDAFDESGGPSSSY